MQRWMILYLIKKLMAMRKNIYTAIIKWSTALLVILLVACTDELYNKSQELGKSVRVNDLMLTTSK